MIRAFEAASDLQIGGPLFGDPEHDRVRPQLRMGNIQCPWFIHREGDVTMGIAMVWATLGDVTLTWIAQISMAAWAGRWVWPRDAGRAMWLQIMALGGVMAVVIEKYAMATGRWRYAAGNPLIPGLKISLLPVIQVSILFPISFLAAGRLAAGRLWS